MQLAKVWAGILVSMHCHLLTQVVAIQLPDVLQNLTGDAGKEKIKAKIESLTRGPVNLEQSGSEPFNWLTTLRNVTWEVIHPDLIPCKTTSDCTNYKPRRKTQKVQNFITKNDYSNMICYQEQFCMVNGSDFAVETMSSVETARRALFTFQLTHAFQKGGVDTMRLRKYAYCSLPKLSYFYAEPRGPSFAVYNDPQDPTTGILIFKPTTTKYEWAMVNANGKKVTCELAATKSNPGATCGLVHDGFQTAFLKLLAQRVLDAVEPYSKLIIVGYSLGGALAQCASVHIPAKNKQVKIMGVYTYASPRLGDAAFVEAFNKSVAGADIHRMVSMSGSLQGPRDFVTLMPPYSDFQHITMKGIGVMCQNATTGEPCRGTDFEIHYYDGYRDAIQRDYDRLGGQSQCLKW